MTGHAGLIRSLKKNGVTDYQSHQELSVSTDIKSDDSPRIFQALKERFQRDSVYNIIEK